MPALKKYLFLSLLSLLLLVAGLQSASAQVPAGLIDYFTYRFSDREGRPSKCDCDYREERIELHADGTFLYLQQRGRLEGAKQQWEKGTWTMRNDSVVDLTTTEEKGTLDIFFKEDVDPDKWHAANGHSSYIYFWHRLYTWGRDKVYE